MITYLSGRGKMRAKSPGTPMEDVLSASAGSVLPRPLKYVKGHTAGFD